MYKNILYGEELNLNLPHDSMGKLIYNKILQNPNKIALVDEFTEESITYGQLLKISCNLSSALRNLGYKKGSNIAVCSENSIYYFCPILAAWFLGITVSTVSNHYMHSELEHALSLVRAEVIFCSKQTVNNIMNVRRTLEFIKKIIVMDFDKNAEMVNFDSFIHAHASPDLNVEHFKITDVDIDNDVAFILFSSGTTGIPKGVMLTHKNLLVNNMFLTDPIININKDEPHLGYLPFFHAAGLITTFHRLLLQTTIIVFYKFDEIKFLKAIEKYRITQITTVPPILIMLAKSQTVNKYNLSSLKEIMSGAAPLDKDMEKEIKERLSLQSIRQGYGMTETTLMVLVVPAGIQRPGSVGKPLPGSSCIIRNIENGKYLEPNKLGEICVKGDMIMKGYYNDSMQTRNSFTDDGWLRTGDLGYYDEEGYVYILDRLKELIKYKSFQVPPAELEALLLKIPGIKDAAVVGQPDVESGELPMAFVVKQEKSNITENNIMEFVAKNVSKHKHLHGGVRFINEIPKSPSGKILRRELKELLKNEISKL